MTTSFVETDKGRIAVIQSREDGPPILLIHGNSSCKEIFSRQFADPQLSQFRLVAFDLPGHGESADAAEPAATYTFAGYASVAEQVIAALGLARPTVFGWSLGGHIALEMVGRGADLAGVMISGTPPVKAELESLMAGFNIDPTAENLTGKRDFTDEDVIAYATHTSGVDGIVDPHALRMVRRTDGRARETMFGSVVAGQALDEREIVATMAVPLAIVNGEADPFIQAPYFDRLTYGSLWPRGVVRMVGAGHAPFLQKPQEFNFLLSEFAGQA